MYENDYYKKYIKYKNKYQQLKLTINTVKYGGENKIYDINEINQQYLIKLNPFILDCAEEAYKYIAENILSANIDFDSKNLYFVKNNNNIIGIIARSNLGIFVKLSNSVVGYIQKIINRFTYKCISEEAKEKILWKKLLDGVFNFNMTNDTIKYFIDNYKTPEEAYNFIISFINHNDQPAGKTIMYYIVRAGNIKLLEFILDYVGETYFQKLMVIMDFEGRTLFMISTRVLPSAVCNQKQIFDLILKYTPVELIYHRDKLGRNALDYYCYREIDNPYILQKLQKIFG